MIIAVDGPSAAGKGTIARAIAARLGYHFLDTGTLYRRVGLAMLQGGFSGSDVAAAVRIATSLNLDLGRDADLRTEQVAAMASVVAAIPEVRSALLDFQRQFAARKPGAVLDGRDIGTVVCPDAELKFFVTAATDVRARRRYEELRGTGARVEFDEILADVMARDERDASRAAAPTRPADDAIMIDTSELDRDEVLKAVLEVVADHQPK